MWAIFLIELAVAGGYLYEVFSNIHSVGYLKWYIIWAVVLVFAIVKHT